MDFLAFECFDGFLDREIHREPAVHPRSVLSWVCAVHNLLIELCSEVACKAMQFTLVLLDCEANTIELLHTGRLSFTVLLDYRLHLDIFKLRIGYVAEGEHWERLVATGESCGENSNNIGKLEGI